MVSNWLLSAYNAPPAGGSAIGQVIGATLGAMVATSALIWVIAAHRGSRIRWLGRLASASERQTGLPGWAAVPELVLGAVLILVCSAVSLVAFPLDDIWHRIFGQDVTLWGPTHLLLFGGASLSLIGLWVLRVEAAKAQTGAGDPPRETFQHKIRDVFV